MVAERLPLVREALLPAPPCSCATWRRSAATSCSAPAAATSATRRSPPATSARPARAAPPSPAPPACTRSSARASTASRCTPPTCAWRWSRSTPSCTSRARTGRAAIPLTEFYVAPGDAPGHRERARARRADHRVEVPLLPAGARSGYLKVRDRASYEFALSSAAAALVDRGRRHRAGPGRAGRRRDDPVAGPRGRGDPASAAIRPTQDSSAAAANAALAASRSRSGHGLQGGARRAHDRPRPGDRGRSAP